MERIEHASEEDRLCEHCNGEGQTCTECPAGESCDHDDGYFTECSECEGLGRRSDGEKDAASNPTTRRHDHGE